MDEFTSNLGLRPRDEGENSIMMNFNKIFEFIKINSRIIFTVIGMLIFLKSFLNVFLTKVELKQLKAKAHELSVVYDLGLLLTNLKEVDVTKLHKLEKVKIDNFFKDKKLNSNQKIFIYSGREDLKTIEESLALVRKAKKEQTLQKTNVIKLIDDIAYIGSFPAPLNYETKWEKALIKSPLIFILNDEPKSLATKLSNANIELKDELSKSVDRKTYFPRADKFLMFLCSLVLLIIGSSFFVLWQKYIFSYNLPLTTAVAFLFVLFAISGFSQYVEAISGLSDIDIVGTYIGSGVALSSQFLK